MEKKTITEKNQSNKFSVQMKLLNIDKMTDIQKNLSINCFEIKQRIQNYFEMNIIVTTELFNKKFAGSSCFDFIVFRDMYTSSVLISNLDVGKIVKKERS